MGSADNGGELDHARAELRQLRETIVVLRDALETGEAQRQAERRSLVAQLEAQADQAREAIAAMRAQLEAEVAERHAAVQAALAQSADEIAQLHATIEALRDAVTAEHEAGTAERDTMQRAFRAERDQLHEMVAALRARLETVDAT